MIQIQEIGTKQTAELMLVRAGASAEGSVKFDSHPLASAVAAFSGRGVRLVFTFPNGVVGLYEGAVDERSGDLVEGTCAGSNGATATWSGSRVACPR